MVAFDLSSFLFWEFSGRLSAATVLSICVRDGSRAFPFAFSSFFFATSTFFADFLGSLTFFSLAFLAFFC